jgi:hypothetical protein
LGPPAQFLTLFIAQFQQSLIIGHIIMTLRSRCRYHRDRLLAQNEGSATAYDYARKAGLIGAVKGAVRDLSTNPKYFDGFGAS